MSSADTIFALATSPGKSGVGIIRISGPRASHALSSLCGLASPAPRHAHFVSFVSPKTKETIDRGITLFFQSPNSFTGEDVVELQIHGSIAVIRELLETLGGIDGLRHAEPGEFSRRAFINGKMDLMEAEGLADLIDAETHEQKSQALRQMQGQLSSYYDELRTRITRCLAHLEAYIDFPDEEIPESVLAGLGVEIKLVQAVIHDALQDQKRGERLRDGLNVVILGAPNVGKSSLLNVIARRDAAIVSTKAGTTRDAIEIHLDIAGYPVVLVDTAGIRPSDDEIEAEGIRRALERAESADLKLVMFDGTQQNNQAGLSLLDQQSIAVINKSDLPSNAKLAVPSSITISTKTGEGIDRLLKMIEERVVGHFSSYAAPFITRSRHRDLLSDAQRHLEKSLKDAPLELKCEELRLAVQAVGKITGKIQVDDVLDVIFKSFCIGK